MKILKTEKFGKITPMLQENYGNLHARMGLMLPEGVARMFAKFTMQAAGGGAQWSVSEDWEEELHPYGEATEMERDRVSLELARAQGALQQKFPAMADKLLHVPDEQNIFCHTDPLGQTHVVLTAWGFRRNAREQVTNVISLALDRGVQMTDGDVHIQVVYNDSTPVADATGAVFFMGNEIPFTTDGAGLFCLGRVRTGKTFTVCLDEGGKSEPFEVTKDRTHYQVRVQKYTSAVAVAMEADRTTPVPGVAVTLGDKTLYTESEGEALFPDIPYEPGRTLHFTAPGFTEAAIPLCADAAQNRATLYRKTRCPGPDAEPGPVPPPEPPVPTADKVCLHLVDKSGKPLGSHPVKVMCRKGFEQTVTDSMGRIWLNAADLLEGEKPKVRLTRPKASGKRSNQPLNTNNTPDIPAK